MVSLTLITYICYKTEQKQPWKFCNTIHESSHFVNVKDTVKYIHLNSENHYPICEVFFRCKRQVKHHYKSYHQIFYRREEMYVHYLCYQIRWMTLSRISCEGYSRWGMYSLPQWKMQTYTHTHIRFQAVFCFLYTYIRFLWLDSFHILQGYNLIEFNL